MCHFHILDPQNCRTRTNSRKCGRKSANWSCVNMPPRKNRCVKCNEFARRSIMSINQKRRNILKGIGAGAAMSTLGGVLMNPARAQISVRVGYLHTLAVDGQIWLGEHMGTWREQGLDI